MNNVTWMLRGLICLCALPLILFPVVTAAEAAGEKAKAAAERPAFEDPPDLHSENGSLTVELTAASRTIEVGGKKVTTYLYNGLFAPPTLHVRPGDKLFLKLNNERRESTNLHYHGANVSPKQPQDNVYIRIPSKGNYQYEVDFPEDHPQGLFWYHPHWHGTTEYQIGGGMSGLLSVDGVLDPWPELKGITERDIILRDIQIVNGKVPNPPDPGNPTMRTVNGLVNPTIPIRPGEVQFWRVGNIGADIFYDLEIEGHKMYEIARDGIRHNQPVVLDTLLLPTSARSEFLVVGGEPGEYVFRTKEINMGPAGDPHPRTTLATLVSSGTRSKEDVALPKVFPKLVDLRDVETSCTRVVDFSETPDGEQFCMNNTGTDMNMINTTVRIGGVEEWTINNCSAENHVFHIHQLQFQVIKQNGKDVPFTGLQDTITIDYRSVDKEHPDRCKVDAQGNAHDCTCPTEEDPWGSVVLRVPFTNPIIEGKAIYQCHIGEHEDNGMMHTIEMSPTAGRCEAGTPSTIDRLKLSSTERAICKPRTAHDHSM